MHPSKPPTVYKYFDLADRFVRVRVLDPENAGLEVGEGMNRSAYRQSVIRACLEDFGAKDLNAALCELHPCDPIAAEDHLYQLCVSVNPGLEIHSVSLAQEEGSATRTAPERKKRGPRDFCTKLRRRIDQLSDRIRERVIGQDDAVDRVVAAVRRAAAGLAEERRPLASFLFVGRSGTGKTELARALAAELLNDETAVTRIDCSEFAMAHEYSKLIGAPPGYVGHGDGGQLTEAIAKKPESVVLFDEIEKAHPRLHNLLLQVLDEGHLTDGKGQRVDFDRAFVIMTSNVGAREVARESRLVGFSRVDGLNDEAVGEIASRELSQAFSPEFLGRIDETVNFRALDEGDARKIARRQLTELALRVKRGGRRVAFTPAVAGWVAERGFALESGAREIRRTIRSLVEAPLSEELLDTRRNRPWIHVGVRKGELDFRLEE